jgi:hypothetical protein
MYLTDRVASVALASRGHSSLSRPLSLALSFGLAVWPPARQLLVTRLQAPAGHTTARSPATRSRTRRHRELSVHQIVTHSAKNVQPDVVAIGAWQESALTVSEAARLAVVMLNKREF